MAIHELNRAVLVYPAILPASTAISQHSSAIDTRGYSRALVMVNCGLAASSAELDVVVREGPGTVTLVSQRMASTWHTHISGSSFTQMTAANDQTCYVGEVNLESRQRYISVMFQRDGTNDVTAGCLVALFKKQYAPSTQYNTLAFSI